VRAPRAWARSSRPRPPPPPPSRPYVGQVNHILSQSLPTVRPSCTIAVYVTRIATIGADRRSQRNAVASSSHREDRTRISARSLFFFLPPSLSLWSCVAGKRTLVVFRRRRDSLTRTTRGGAKSRSAGHESILAG